MRERVFGLETEYAVLHRPKEGGRTARPADIVEAMSELLVRGYGLPDTRFLVSGAKFYYDVGHAEWSLPECRSAREAAVYDKAADHLLASLLDGVEAELAARGMPGRVLLVKNNVDPDGHTYGCHENYMAEKVTRWLDLEDHLRLTVRYLVPFLVSRQILTGSGRVGWGPRREQGLGYQIMQRADFIDEVVSKETRGQRAIVNLGRESEPLMRADYRRLHLILGDANLSGWASFMKLGTTGVVLRVLEDADVGAIPHLADPVSALRRISRDPTCRARVALAQGGESTAIEIQRVYLRQAEAHFERDAPSPEEETILAEWGAALDVLEEDPIGLDHKADWVTKKRVLDRYLDARGLRLSDIPEGTPECFRALRIDLDYHDISPAQGLYYRLLGGAPDSLVTGDEIARAQREPPPYTRARVRGEVIASARRTGNEVKVDGWDEIDIGQGTVKLPDALGFVVPAVHRLLAGRA
jgi:proteasome accessory factor A